MASTPESAQSPGTRAHPPAAPTSQPASRYADLVMEGGGVKGMAFVGALDVLSQAGYAFPRVAGTSAGAISGALVAGLQHAGEPLSRMHDIMTTLQLAKMRDSGRVGSLLGPLHPIADLTSLLLENGLYEGGYLLRWLTGVLADLGVRSFGDLKREDPGSALPPEHEYSLVVVTSDLSRQRMLVLPWDYAGYGVDPAEQSVAEAVRASAAIPFFFEPSVLRTPRGKHTLTDGGLLSNYPITIFDQPDRSRSRWPTIGIRLSAREDVRATSRPVRGLVAFALAVAETAILGNDARHIDDPSTVARTVFVDTGGISAINFSLSESQQAQLVEAGRTAAAKHLAANPGEAAT